MFKLELSRGVILRSVATKDLLFRAGMSSKAGRSLRSG